MPYAARRRSSGACGSARLLAVVVWELRENLSTYDACYVAVAETHDLTLVTGDAKIERAGVARCPVRVIR